MNEDPYSIEVKALTKLYGKTKAINNLNFTISKGNIVGFLGPNGAGKSTTMRILGGLIPATSGVARINGISIGLDPLKVKRQLAFMPENNPLPEDMRVIEYLKYRASLKEVPGREIKKRIDHVMEQCELTHTAGRKMIKALSKGYRQRVGIADALLANPSLLIMDEPTIGLDPHQILTFRNLIKQLKGNMTILLSSHILPEIEFSCDEVIIINQGHIVTQGTSVNLRQEFTPENIYELSIRANKNDILALISAMDPEANVITNSNDGDFTDIVFTSNHPPSICEQLVLAIQKNPSWVLRKIVHKEPTLEDIFIAATRPSWKAPIYNIRQNTLRIAS